MRVSAHNDAIAVLSASYCVKGQLRTCWFSALVSEQMCTFYLIFCASFVSYIHKSLLKSPKMLDAWQVPLLVFMD